MDTREILLFVFDSKDNFEKSKKYLGEEGATFKRFICIESFADFEYQLSKLNDDDLFFLVVHVFYTAEISGIKSFVTSGIKQKYPQMPIMYISEGNSVEIKHKMLDNAIPIDEIYKYHHVQSSLAEYKFKAYTKRLLENMKGNSTQNSETIAVIYPKVEYAIITALYKDEFEQLKRFFDFPNEEQVITGTKVYSIGYLKSNRQKKVVAAIPNATGMIDSAIVATQMIELFKPKFILMSGVCGGSSDTELGDIIVAKNIFTFQKGKLSDVKAKGKNEEILNLELFDIDKNKVDYDHLYDVNGNQIAISIEKFEIEHDSFIYLDTFLEDKIILSLERISGEINEKVKEETMLAGNRSINIKIEPIACSTMVINKDGYFEDTIKAVDRRTAAVEMESYGVARACQYANDGKTKHIIFKSVMDKTVNKEDTQNGINYKKFAAYTSALFLNYLLEFEII